MVLSKKRARHVIEEIIALFPDAQPSLDFRIILIISSGDALCSNNGCRG